MFADYSPIWRPEVPSAAARYVEGLYSACQRLVAFPLSGRRYNDAFRMLVFRNLLIFYWYDQTADVVSIAMVVDGRRDLKALLDRRVEYPALTENRKR